MKEIKFRTWDINEKKMGKVITIGSFVTTKENCPDCEIMQFTGLKDSEDVEIWEGDVVRVCIEQLFDDVEKVGIVIYDAPAFKIDFPDEGVTIGIVDEYSMSVIGNIYENPELLK